MRGSLPSASGTTSQARAATGIKGLDKVLGGGLTSHRLYLIEGVPGSGKTTLALQFLMEGAQRGEPVLYITLSETEEELRQVAASHGWSLRGLRFARWFRAKRGSGPTSRTRCFTPRRWSLGRRRRTTPAMVGGS